MRKLSINALPFALLSMCLVGACGDDSPAKVGLDESAEDGGHTDAAMGDAGDPAEILDAGDKPGPVDASSPCPYAVTGGQSFPSQGATYLCTNNSRLFQDEGAGPYTILLGAGFYVGNDSSTLALSLSSAVPPKAGDTWTLGSGDVSGSLELSFQQGMTNAKIWKASIAPVLGTASVKFTSVTLMHGTSDPEDVYYLFEATYTATVKGQTADTADVTITGSYKTTTLPLGA